MAKFSKTTTKTSQSATKTSQSATKTSQSAKHVQSSKTVKPETDLVFGDNEPVQATSAPIVEIVSAQATDVSAPVVEVTAPVVEVTVQVTSVSVPVPDTETSTPIVSASTEVEEVTTPFVEVGHRSKKTGMKSSAPIKKVKQAKQAKQGKQTKSVESSKTDEDSPSHNSFDGLSVSDESEDDSKMETPVVQEEGKSVEGGETIDDADSRQRILTLTIKRKNKNGDPVQISCEFPRVNVTNATISDELFEAIMSSNFCNECSDIALNVKGALPIDTIVTWPVRQGSDAKFVPREDTSLNQAIAQLFWSGRTAIGHTVSILANSGCRPSYFTIPDMYGTKFTKFVNFWDWFNVMSSMYYYFLHFLSVRSVAPSSQNIEDLKWIMNARLDVLYNVRRAVRLSLAAKFGKKEQNDLHIKSIQERTVSV